MGKRENSVEKFLDEEIVKIGGITRKWTSPGRSGVPDRIVIVEGLVTFVEVKTLDGKLSSDQEREHVRLKEAGAAVLTVYGRESVTAFVNTLRILIKKDDGLPS